LQLFAERRIRRLELLIRLDDRDTQPGDRKAGPDRTRAEQTERTGTGRTERAAPRGHPGDVGCGPTGHDPERRAKHPGRGRVPLKRLRKVRPCEDGKDERGVRHEITSLPVSVAVQLWRIARAQLSA